MIRKSIGTALGLVLVLGAPATAASEGWVTKCEYHRVHKNMTKQRAERIFDTHGQSVQASRHRQTRTYEGWKPLTYIYVTYRKDDGRWRVVSKGYDSLSKG